MTDARDDALERLRRIRGSNTSSRATQRRAKRSTIVSAQTIVSAHRSAPALTLVRLLAIVAAVPVWQAMGLVGR